MTDTLQRPPATELRRFTITSVEGETPDGTSHRIRSDYVEAAWMQFLGPVTIAVARRIDLILSTEHKSHIDVVKWAEQLAITPEDLLAACHRLVRYGLAEFTDRDPTLLISRHWPQVPPAISTPRHRQALVDLPDTELP